MHPKIFGKSCQHLVPPKVTGPRQASSTAQGQPAPGKPPHQIQKIEGTQVPFWPDVLQLRLNQWAYHRPPPKLGQAPVTHLKNGLAKLQCEKMSRRCTKQKNSGNRRIDRKQQPKPSPTNCSSLQRLRSFLWSSPSSLLGDY